MVHGVIKHGEVACDEKTPLRSYHWEITDDLNEDSVSVLPRAGCGL